MSVMVMALELYVGDLTWPTYKRALAWVKLLRIWTVMRQDDTQGLLPKNVVLYRKGSEATLDRTKVRGPGRKVRWRSVSVSTMLICSSMTGSRKVLTFGAANASASIAFIWYRCPQTITKTYVTHGLCILTWRQ